ncbi:MAG: hypothetical protein LBL72_01125 [Candidatus Accumulibacter sp.]|jgi:hypothetical protein|nr:hypothetical protein [Accumulibacter sp.]
MTADEKALKDLLDRENLELHAILADIRKKMLEGDKLKVEARWHPFVVGAGVFGAAVAFAKFFV